MRRHIIPAIAVVGLFITGLTACSASPVTPTDCTATLKPGALSDSVQVSGKFGKSPEVEIPDTETAISTTQRTIVTAPKNPERITGEEALVSANLSFFDSASGKKIYESPAYQGSAAGSEFLMVSPDTVNPLTDAVQCAAAGTRVVVAIAPEEGAQLATQLGADPQAALVGVIDVVATSPLRAEGPTRGLPSGYPAVVTDENGRPGVVLPPRDAPAGTNSATRIVGDGETVAAEDNVVAQVLTVGWDGSEGENTWVSGVVALQSEDRVAMSGYTFRPELTGKTVGSQVVIVENEPNATPRVVVVDIIAAS